MNRDQNFVAFLSLFIFCGSICPKTTDAESNKIDERIVAEVGGNVTLLCNPSLRENATLSSLANDFEWEIANEDVENVPIFSNGKLWLFLFEKELDNSSYAIDKYPPGTLIIRKLKLSKNTYTCTFSTPSTKISYTYFLEVNGNRSYDSSLFRIKLIESSNRGDQVTLPCGYGMVTNSSSDLSYYWLSRKYIPDEDAKDVEVISLNRSILLKNNTKGFQVAENRSLIIESLSPFWGTTFECHMSNGSVFEHDISLRYYEGIGKDESRDWTVKNVKKQNISVIYGTRNVVLPCPSTDNSFNSSVIWFYFDANIFKFTLDLLFLDQKKMAYAAKPSSDFYDINDDGSLIILAVRIYQFGRYVCQRSTGEQYSYNLKQEYKNISETISIRNRSSITLPCPMNHQIDRDYNIISWRVSSKSNKLVGGILVMNGKIITPREYIPDNVKLADDKTSLIVSNLTSSSIDYEYTCELTTSRNTYEYRLTN